MNEIKCPKCGTVFQINETDYDSIVKQIRDSEFHKEIDARENAYKKELESAVKLARNDIEKELTEKINKKDIEINKLKGDLDSNEKNLQMKL